MSKIKLCRECKKELLKELKGKLYWEMIYGIPAFKLKQEIIKMIEESEEK